MIQESRSDEERLANTIRQHPDVMEVEWARGSTGIRYWVTFKAHYTPDAFHEFYDLEFGAAWIVRERYSLLEYLRAPPRVRSLYRTGGGDA